jgi:hypothetical protein
VRYPFVRVTRGRSGTCRRDLNVSENGVKMLEVLNGSATGIGAGAESRIGARLGSFCVRGGVLQ